MAEPPPERKDAPISTPNGPHPHGVDEASGGADSSPFENLPSGEKAPAAEDEKRSGRQGSTPDAGADRAP